MGLPQLRYLTHFGKEVHRATIPALPFSPSSLGPCAADNRAENRLPGRAVRVGIVMGALPAIARGMVGRRAAEASRGGVGRVAGRGVPAARQGLLPTPRSPTAERSPAPPNVPTCPTGPRTRSATPRRQRSRNRSAWMLRGPRSGTARPRSRRFTPRRTWRSRQRLRRFADNRPNVAGFSRCTVYSTQRLGCRWGAFAPAARGSQHASDALPLSPLVRPWTLAPIVLPRSSSRCCLSEAAPTFFPLRSIALSS